MNQRNRDSAASLCSPLPVDGYAYCRLCDAIRPVRIGQMVEVSVCGKYRGSDTVCNRCHFVIAAMFVQIETMTSSTQVCDEHDQFGGDCHASDGASASERRS